MAVVRIVVRKEIDGHLNDVWMAGIVRVNNYVADIRLYVVSAYATNRSYLFIVAIWHMVVVNIRQAAIVRIGDVTYVTNFDMNFMTANYVTNDTNCVN